MILLVVWSANADGSAVTSKASFKVNLQIYTIRYLPNELCDCNCVIHRTNRARCTLNMKILDLLNEESVSRESSGRASL